MSRRRVVQALAPIVASNGPHLLHCNGLICMFCGVGIPVVGGFVGVCPSNVPSNALIVQQAAPAVVAAVNNRQSSSSYYNTLLKLIPQLPKWTNNGKCSEFLKNIENILTGSGVPSDEWYSIINQLISISDNQQKVGTLDWITNNIIKPKLAWIACCKTFKLHFERSDYKLELENRYNDKSYKQSQSESVQQYSDRFIDLCTELEYQLNAEQVISHYENGLQTNVFKEYQKFLMTEQMKDSTYKITSVIMSSELCIKLDKVRMTVNEHVVNRSGDGGNRHASNLGKRKSYAEQQNDSSSAARIASPKWCSFHKNDSHSDKDCRSQNRETHAKKPKLHHNRATNKPDSHSATNSNSHKSKINAKTNSNMNTVTCYKCGEQGHKSNELDKCPMAKKGSDDNNNNSSKQVRFDQNNSSSNKSQGKPNTSTSVKHSQYKPAGSHGNNRSGHAHVELIAVDISNDSTINSVGVASALPFELLLNKDEELQLWLKINNKLFKATVDQGSQTCVMNESVAKELNIDVEKVDGKLITFNNIKVDRYETEFVNVNVFCTGSDYETKEFRVKFSVTTMQHDIIVGKDLLYKYFPRDLPRQFMLPADTINNVESTGDNIRQVRTILVNDNNNSKLLNYSVEVSVNHLQLAHDSPSF